MILSEEQIANWSTPPSETEDARCLNAVNQTTDVLRSVFGNSIKLIRQGSHTNRTNVRVDSDVDMAVVHTGYFFGDISGLSEVDKATYEQTRSRTNYTFRQYKDSVEAALRAKFPDSVERKNKCLRVRENSNRAPIDIVPAFEHHRFSSLGVVSAYGLEFQADDGKRIVGFPEQHYANGVAKNDATGRGFKRTVRILKRVRNRLVELGHISENAMPSFFLESLIWNVPNATFQQATWRGVGSQVAAKVWNDMRNEAIAKEYAEVSDLHWLFRGRANRTYSQAENFMLRAWQLLTQ